jgi:hypothetical protein
MNDGWLDEPKAPEKDSLVAEETETNQECREEGQVRMVVVSETKESKTHYDMLQQLFSSGMASRFNCYIQKIRSEDPPDDLRITFASFII